MRITLNDFKDRVILKRYVMPATSNDEVPKRRIKTIKSVWVAIQSLSLHHALQQASLLEVEDGRVRLSQAYLLYAKEDPGFFDCVTWEGALFRRLSAVQKEGAYWRWIIGAFEEKEL